MGAARARGPGRPADDRRPRRRGARARPTARRCTRTTSCGSRSRRARCETRFADAGLRGPRSARAEGPARARAPRVPPGARAVGRASTSVPRARSTWALDHGWAPEEISYTGTNCRERDLDADPRRRRAPERRPADRSSTGSGRRAPGSHGGDPREPADRGHARGRRRDPLHRAAPDEVRHLRRAARRRARDRARATGSRSTPCTSTWATATSTTACPTSRRPCGACAAMVRTLLRGAGCPIARGEHRRRARRAAARGRRPARPGGVGRILARHLGAARRRRWPPSPATSW